jgi:hypothetical protein
MALNINYEEISKRLLSLASLGCHLEDRDGHIWVEPAYMDMGDNEESHSHLHYILKEHGIHLNNKIYGGVLEALYTIDEALRLSGHKSLLGTFIGWDDTDPYFLGEKGVATNRIAIGEKGSGGIS